MKREIWHLLTSMRTALFLLLVIAGIAVLGSLIPQGESQHFYHQIYGTWRTKTIIFLQLHDVFHAWVFLAPTFLLLASLLACSIQRFSPVWHQATTGQYIYHQEFYEGAPVKGQALVKGSPGEVAGILDQNLRKGRYRVGVEQKEDQFYLYAHRGRWGPFGSLATHLGVVIIIVGALYGGLTGFKTYANIPEGDTFYVEPGGFAVQLKDFFIDYYDGYLPKQYYSNLKIIENGREVLEKEISVNNPLTYKGINLYQFDYGWVLDGTVQGYGLAKTLTLLDRELTPLLGDLNIKVFFYPDFVLDAAGHPSTRSPLPNNPRVVCAIYRGTSVLGFDLAELGKPVRIPVDTGGDLTVIFTGYRQYTGLQMARDPGTPVVYAGAGLGIIGLFLSFYVWPRRVWVKVIPQPGGSRVFWAGIANRFPARLAQETRQLMSQLNTNKGEST